MGKEGSLTIAGVVALVSHSAQALKALADAVMLLPELRVLLLQPLLLQGAASCRGDGVLVAVCKSHTQVAHTQIAWGAVCHRLGPQCSLIPLSHLGRN